MWPVVGPCRVVGGGKALLAGAFGRILQLGAPTRKRPAGPRLEGSKDRQKVAPLTGRRTALVCPEHPATN